MGRTRISSEQLRVNVAQALLHLGEPTWLADSPLAELPDVQQRCQPSLIFAEGHALATYLHEIVQSIVARLDGHGKEAILCAVLTGVCQGKSIARIARDQGRARETVSRHYWTLAVRLVTDEMVA